MIMRDPSSEQTFGKNRFQCRENVRPDTDVDGSATWPVKPHSAARCPEKSDDYPAIVARLNAHWRVIECNDAIQWILQRRKGHWAGRPQWQGQHYCRTRSGLLACIREHCGPVDEEVLAVLRSLPERIVHSAFTELPALTTENASRTTSESDGGRNDR